MTRRYGVIQRRPLVKEEGTHWRDRALSERRRLWGYDAPWLDVDELALAIEYDHATPVALTEFKLDGPNQRPWPELERHASIVAARRLADAASIPFLVVYYQRAPWTFRVHAGNAAARELLGQPTIVCSELDYVQLQYRIRRRPMPATVLADLGVDGKSTRELLHGT